MAPPSVIDHGAKNLNSNQEDGRASAEAGHKGRAYSRGHVPVVLEVKLLEGRDRVRADPIFRPSAEPASPSPTGPLSGVDLESLRG
jgi:hypothetical protein